jgi:hypothetical protein
MQTLHARWLRRTAWMLALASLPAALSLWQGRARANERILDAGAELLAYARASELDGSRTLVVNGLPVHVLSGSTADPVSVLLDTFQARCRRASGGLDRVPRDMPRSRRWPRIAERALDPVLRHDDPSGGYVGCLDLGRAVLPAEQLVDRVRRFLESGDVSEVGDVRFAWAFRSDSGTHYIAVYTDGPMPLAKLFPVHGDAPGTDVVGMPRPSRARRVLSAFQRDASPMVASYESELSPEASVRAFRAQLARAGSTLVSTVPARDAAGEAHFPHVVIGGDEQSAIAFATRASTGKTLLTVVRLR